MEFINEREYYPFIIRDYAKSIVYKNIEYATETVFFFTRDQARFKTTDFDIKFSKGELNLYDLHTRELLDTFVFKRFIKHIPNPTDSSETNTNLSDKIFCMKKDFFLILNTEKRTLVNGDTTEFVVDVYDVGDIWTVFVTDLDNKLFLSKKEKYHHKFNGIPISEIK